MRKTPTYDWDWFISHTPFKKILTEYCDLNVKKEIEKFYICCGIYDIYNHYEISVNLKKFQNNIEEIKTKLLNTNVCKKNKEIFDYVNKLEGGKSELCSLIMDGCIANCEGRFSWNWLEAENSCSGCIYEDDDGSTSAISNCVCCSRKIDYAKNDYYKSK